MIISKSDAVLWSANVSHGPPIQGTWHHARVRNDDSRGLLSV